MAKLGDYFYKKAVRVGSALAFAAVLTGGIAALPAQAQHGRYGHDDYGYGRRMSNGDLQRIAMVNGYSEGYEHGIEDRRNRAGFNYQHDSEFRSATSGYRSEWGSVGVYQSGFRSGYARGYQDAYYGRARNRSYAGYGNSAYDPYASMPNYRRNTYDPYGGYGSGGYYGDRDGDLDRNEVARRAAQQGYYDGFYRGQYDRRTGERRPKPTGHGAYQYGLNGFDPEWGWTQTYQQYYRQYFVQGYNAGFGQRSFDRRYQRRWW